MLKIAYANNYCHPLPEGHRFPMEKYELLPEQLLHEGTIKPENLFVPKPMAAEKILTTHSAEYWQKLNQLALSKREERKTGFPLSKALVEREITIMQGTLEAAEYALKHKVAMNIAGGTHHAYQSSGEGFCLLNDIALAANHLLETQQARQILVVDLDVHQGNGTAKIFEQNPAVFTFSMHGEKNYPIPKEQSDLDIGLPDNTTDAHYLNLLDNHLKQLIDEVQPDFIFFQSGVDVLASDKLGRLALTLEGCKQRDSLVFECCKQNNIPVVASMGGGYSEDIKIILEAHANTYRVAQELYF